MELEPEYANADAEKMPPEEVLQNTAEILDDLIIFVDTELNDDERSIVDALAETKERVIPKTRKKSDSKPDLTRAVKIPKEIEQEMQRLVVNARKAAGNNEDDQHRAGLRACIDFIQKIARNDFESASARWKANLTNAAVRTGLIVFLLQILKEYIAFEIEKSKELGNDQAVAVAFGVTSLVLTVALHASGLGRQWTSGNSTIYSVFSRIGIVLVAIGATASCLFTGTWNSLILRVPAMMSFCMLRDLCHGFFPLKTNVQRMPIRAVLSGGAIYAALQYLVGMGSDLLAPRAGAGGVPSSGNQTEAELAVVAMSHLVMSDTAIKALLNGIADAIDDVAAPALMYAFSQSSVERDQSWQEHDLQMYLDVESKLETAAQHVLEEPNALKRQELIRTINIEMHETELERLTTKFESRRLNSRELKVLRKLLRLREQLAEAKRAGSKLSFTAASVMASGITKTPDFLKLDSTLKSAFLEENKLHPDKALSSSQINAFVRQLYVSAFIGSYMPMPTTDLQRTIIAEVLATQPGLMPSLLRKAAGEKAQLKLAPAKSGGLQIKLRSMVPGSCVELVTRLGNQFFNTSASRMTFYVGVFGSVFSAAKAINESDENPVHQSAMLNIVLVMAVFVGYFFFYGVHDSKARPGQRLALPSSEGESPDAEASDPPTSNEEIDMLAEKVDRRTQQINKLLGAGKKSILEPRSPGGSSTSSASRSGNSSSTS